MMSPICSPAWTAGPRGVTDDTYRPVGLTLLSPLETGTTPIPKSPWSTRPLAISASAMRCALAAGIANPSPMLPPTAPPIESLAVVPAVGTPTRSP